MSEWLYHIYGLTVASDFPLGLEENEIQCFPPSADMLRLELCPSAALADVARRAVYDEERWYKFAELPDGGAYMGWEDWFEFLVSADGRRIQVAASSGCDVASLQSYLTTFAVRAALLQRGEETLHATVIRSGDMGLALLGASGSGKSTLAAEFVRTGASLVTDDMLRLKFDNDVRAYAGPRRLKLFAEPLSTLLPTAISRGRFNPLSGKFIVEPLPQPVDDEVELRCAFDLRPTAEDANEPKVERLWGMELFRTISGATMMSRGATPERLRRQFAFAERVARSLPVFSLAYPRRFDALERVRGVMMEAADL